MSASLVQGAGAAFERRRDETRGDARDALGGGLFGGDGANATRRRGDAAGTGDAPTPPLARLAPRIAPRPRCGRLLRARRVSAAASSADSSSAKGGASSSQPRSECKNMRDSFSKAEATPPAIAAWIAATEAVLSSDSTWRRHEREFDSSESGSARTEAQSCAYPRAGAREEHHARQRNHCGASRLNRDAQTGHLGGGGLARAGARTRADNHLHRDDEREGQPRELAAERQQQHRGDDRHREGAERGAGGHAARHQRRRRVALC